MMNAMIKIYVDLIVSGYKTLEQVPEKIRADVECILFPVEEIVE